MKTAFDRVLQIVTGLVPAILAAAGAGPTAAHDDGIVRTVGAGFTGIFRALDLLVAAPAMLLPLGTRAVRAGLASAVITGICGIIAFDIARDLVLAAMPAAYRALRIVGLGAGRATDDAPSRRLVAAVAAVAVTTALLSPAWQVEASAPGGAVVGASLLLLTLWLSLRAEQVGLAMIALVLGLAASYEPLVFVAALTAAGPSIARVKRGRSDVLHVGCAFLLGLFPLVIGFALTRRVPELSLHVPLVSWLERSRSTIRPWAFAHLEIGVPILVAGTIGAVLVVSGGVWRRGLPLVAWIATGLVAIAVHAHAGPERVHATILTGVLAVLMLAAPILALVVVAIARARVPFAEASAALVVVLELVLPIQAVDETTNRRDSRTTNALAIWNDVAWGSAPPAAVVLIPNAPTMHRVASARALGALRGDLLFIPAFDVQSRAGVRARILEPKLTPLYRDMALGVPPEELSLAQLGAERAVLTTFDPKWDRSLSRHLVPVGLTSRFEAEPRGLSERKKALETFLPMKERLVQTTIARKDGELAAATATLLRARAIGMAATGEREVLTRALDDLRAFAPEDAVGTALVRRLLTSKGTIDVRDL